MNEEGWMKKTELLTNAPLFATPNSNPKNTKIVLKISSYLHMARFLGPLFYLTFFWIFFLKHLYKPQFYVGMRQIRLQKKTTHIYRKHPISERLSLCAMLALLA